MSPGAVAVVGLAGAAGALLRHELTGGRPLRALHLVNVAGAFLLGLVVGGGAGELASHAAVGGLGGLTSFSTWMVGARVTARTTTAPRAALLLHVVTPAALAVVAAWLGIRIGMVAT